MHQQWAEWRVNRVSITAGRYVIPLIINERSLTNCDAMRCWRWKGWRGDSVLEATAIIIEHKYTSSLDGVRFECSYATSCPLALNHLNSASHRIAIDDEGLVCRGKFIPPRMYTGVDGKMKKKVKNRTILMIIKYEIGNVKSIVFNSLKSH